MDVNMPVMDGFTATEAIRQRESDKGETRRAIIALTADAFAEDRARCLRAGMDDFLTKPLNLQELMGLLDRWLPRSLPKRLAGSTRSGALLSGVAPANPEVSGPPRVPLNGPTAPVGPTAIRADIPVTDITSVALASAVDPTESVGSESVVVAMASEPKIFDDGVLLKALGGHLGLARQVVISGMSGLPQYFDQIEQAQQRGDRVAAGRAVHTLKGLAGQLGGLRLAQVLIDADQRVKRGEPLEMETFVLIKTEWAALVVVLQQWLAKT